MVRRLKREEVLAIRSQFSAGHTITEIADAYGRSWPCVADVVHGRTYQQVKDGPAPPLPQKTGNQKKSRGKAEAANTFD